MRSRIEKLTAIAEAKNLDCFLITGAASVKYLSGYFFNFETGPSPFQFLPAALVVYPGKAVTLLIADNENAPSTASAEGIVVRPYSSYGFEKELRFRADFLEKLKELLRSPAAVALRVGIEAAWLPFVVAEFLETSQPGIQWIDISDALAGQRAVKDPDELTAIRAAAHLCDTGQASVVKYARPGITELELFAMVRKDMEMVAGTRIPLMADLVSGLRTASGGGVPGTNELKKGDLLLCDLTACLQGYWGDSCNTIALGEPTKEQEAIFLRVADALARGMAAIRPGVEARQVDRVMREAIGSFPHHGGHGVGIHYHEEPRIVPYNTMILVPGMVIALEPAIYRETYGLRLEHLVVVTDTGCERLTRFQHTLSQNF